MAQAPRPSASKASSIQVRCWLGSPKGRFEHTGRVEATIRAAGKTIRLGGVGKAHEQNQTAPRFTTPFTYAMLWSADFGDDRAVESPARLWRP